MIFKIVILTLLAIVIISLGSALYHLVGKKGDSDKLIKSLTWRIGLSAFIFILLLIGQAVGLITPHGL
ncbi:MAG TPA: twin transmembrane helix small protein [Gammaproteobacteria bacterium]|nr:twin transmembrane helix small protein [Gammaproteobacteria bacterium]